MKKGITMGTMPKGLTIKEYFALAKKYGFDGVEVAFTEDGELSPNTTPEQYEQIKKDAAEAGMELYSVFSSVYWKHPFTCEAETENAMALARGQIDAAVALGCNSVLIVPGMVSGEGEPFGSIPYDVAYDRALACMKELAAYGKERGVRVGVENVWNKFLLSPLEMRNFVDAAGEGAAAYFDVGNVLVNGYPEQWIDILGDRICKIHVKDFNNKVGNITGFCDLFEGQVNFKAVVAALKRVGYDDFITAEYSCHKAAPEVQLMQISAALDKIISY